MISNVIIQQLWQPLLQKITILNHRFNIDPPIIWSCNIFTQCMKMLSKMLTSYIDKNHRTVPTFANRSQFTSGLRSVQQKVKSEFYKYTHQHFLPQE